MNSFRHKQRRGGRAAGLRLSWRRLHVALTGDPQLRPAGTAGMLTFNQPNKGHRMRTEDWFKFKPSRDPDSR
jgi:hypothetical protein